MKYRIVYAFPDGYKIKKSIFGIFWKTATFFRNEDCVYDDFEDAKKDMERLKLSGKEVKNE